jgi:hypothetical protein
VGIGLWEWFGQDLRGYEIRLLEVCFIALPVGYSCDINEERERKRERESSKAILKN